MTKSSTDSLKYTNIVMLILIGLTICLLILILILLNSINLDDIPIEWILAFDNLSLLGGGIAPLPLYFLILQGVSLFIVLYIITRYVDLNQSIETKKEDKK